MWESRWHLGKLYFQETPLCHEMANGYCYWCSLAWVCENPWEKRRADKLCQMLWGWSRVLICREVFTRVRPVVHLQVPVADMPHRPLFWAVGEELRGICVLAREDQESVQPQVGLDGEEVSTAAPIAWLRASLTGKSCVDWAKHLRLLSNLILKGSRKCTPMCVSEFHTNYCFSGKIYVVLDKGRWKKSGIDLEAHTGLCGPGKSYLGPPCPWSRAPFQSLGLSVPALVMLQQCWSPWPCWGRPIS